MDIECNILGEFLDLEERGLFQIPAIQPNKMIPTHRIRNSRSLFIKPEIMFDSARRPGAANTLNIGFLYFEANIGEGKADVLEILLAKS